MKKKLAVLGLVAALAVTTVGCGNKYITLGKYSGLTVEYTTAQTEVTDSDVAQKIESDMSQYAQKADKNYKAKSGDTVNIDYKGLLKGKAFEGGTAEGYDLKLGSGTFIDGFEDGLIGTKKGDKLDLNLTFPKSYSSEELAGKAVVFKVKVNEITVTPSIDDVDDAFVKKNIDGYNTVAEYKEGVKKELEEKLEETITEDKKNAAWEKIVADTKVKKYPQDQVDAYISEQKKSYEQYLKNYGSDTSLEDYIKSSGSTMDEFKEQLEKQAKMYVTSDLIAEAIAKKEKLVLTDKEFDKGAEEYSEKYGYDKVDTFIEQVGEENLRKELQRQKVLDFIIEHCTFIYTDATAAPTNTAEAK